MLRTQTCALAGLSLAVLAFGLGYAAGFPNDPHASPKAIKDAQRASLFGARPNWLGHTDNDELFEGVRDRGYAFCFKGGRINAQCTEAQDEAVQFTVLSLLLAEEQRKMRDKATLSAKERRVAANPEIQRRLLNDCWALYKEHGAQDSRLLSVCLGNLTDASPLVPLPVS